jgi:hypothetical protein
MTTMAVASTILLLILVLIWPFFKHQAMEIGTDAEK